ncbi:unnamed protein product [Eruca vesicaria subsp. sativa]|uniref:Uncharacterized protein n=1 Tax=Eruca vesicaria subsp. sativa TaxID=29727 RepID=A0ABC8M5J6_ERUVS|nr:unnamed protein product [Eruca vesicaria subsp. sativa]
MDLKNVRDCKKSSEINLQVRMNKTSERLICSKAGGKGKDRSKQFMEALDILSSFEEVVQSSSHSNGMSKTGTFGSLWMLIINSVALCYVVSLILNRSVPHEIVFYT